MVWKQNSAKHYDLKPVDFRTKNAEGEIQQQEWEKIRFEKVQTTKILMKPNNVMDVKHGIAILYPDL